MWPSLSWAQIVGNELILDINGLVIDETITKIGRDYYELIYQQWEAPPTEMTYTIFMREQPQPGFGSRVSIAINEDVVIDRFLSPRYDVLEEEAKYAVQQLKQYIGNYNQLIRDLEDDKQGTGIY
jgi:curli production assembly/transport component CsgE